MLCALTDPQWAGLATGGMEQIAVVISNPVNAGGLEVIGGPISCTEAPLLGRRGWARNHPLGQNPAFETARVLLAARVDYLVVNHVRRRPEACPS